MIPGFDKIVEERIQKSLREGDFDDLPGYGKPLVLNDDICIPEDIRLAFKILKNADCLPPEIELKREINQIEELLTGMKDTAEKYHTIKKLNFLIMKLNTIRNRAINFEMPERYMADLTERFGSKKSSSEKEK